MVIVNQAGSNGDVVEPEEPETDHDATVGGVIGAVAGAVVGGLAGGPAGAVVGAVIGGAASGAAVHEVDKYDNDYVVDSEADPVAMAHEYNDGVPNTYTGADYRGVSKSADTDGNVIK